jgi:hypothetical protein
MSIKSLSYEQLIDFLVINDWCLDTKHAMSCVPTENNDTVLVPNNVQIRLGLKEVLRVSLVPGKSDPLVLNTYDVTSMKEVGVPVV